MSTRCAPGGHHDIIITFMTTRALLNRKREDILRLAAENGASNVRIFGSVVRGEERPDSDVDFLVVMDEGRSLLDLIHLEQSLTDFLKRRAQVVSEGGLNPHFRDSILHDATPL